MKKKITLIFLAFLLIINFQGISGESDSINMKTDSLNNVTEKTLRVCKFDIKEQIAPPIWRITKKAFGFAKDTNADLIIIHMNTYGGMLDAADSIRTIVLQSKIPVYVFVDNNAASAGALISIACDSIYMRPGANIGAATVVNQKGEAMPDKYQSYMRSMMRATAETKGRDPDIAQSMVDPRISIPGVVDSGKVLTFTTKEAITNDFCEGEAENIDEVLKLSGIENYEIVEQKISAADKFIGFFINPAVSGILIMIIIGGIYFELQSPGLGFPSVAAVVAALLYFAPLYVEGLANNWEIVIFIIGVILVAVEIFAIPGFGVAGVSGLILIVTGLTLSMVDNIGFDFTDVQLNGLLKAFFIVTISIFLSVIGSMYLSKKMFTTTMFGHLALDDTQPSNEGYTSSDTGYKSMISKTGFARTDLRPAGKVEIEDEVFDATAVSGYIGKNDEIKVVKYETGQLFVMKIFKTES